MKTIDRRTCGLIKAATIEADQHRRPTFIDGFAPHDRREYGQAPVKAGKMTPAEMTSYLAEKSKEWGQPLRPVRNIS
jgi:hypothetical protein